MKELKKLTPAQFAKLRKRAEYGAKTYGRKYFEHLFRGEFYTSRTVYYFVDQYVPTFLRLAYHEAVQADAAAAEAMTEDELNDAAAKYAYAECERQGVIKAAVHRLAASGFGLDDIPEEYRAFARSAVFPPNVIPFPTGARV